jgi:hypothetical protein
MGKETSRTVGTHIKTFHLVGANHSLMGYKKTIII